MINRLLTLFLLAGFLYFLPAPVLAQYVDLHLEVETESTIKIERSINFGSFRSNGGTKSIMMGDVNMGVLSINAIETQELLISYKTWNHLKHSNPSIPDRVPLHLEVQYGFSRNNFRDTQALSKTFQSVLIKENPDIGPWNNLYLFFYGAVEIGDIAPGSYSTEVVLNIQYI